MLRTRLDSDWRFTDFAPDAGDPQALSQVGLDTATWHALSLPGDVNAALVRGPLGAFKAIGRGVHRWLDLVVMGVIVVGAVQPWLAVESSGRLIMFVVLVPLAFLWFYTDWAERLARRERRAARAGDGAESVGRSAGRFAGNAYSAARQAIRDRSGD